MAKFANGSEKYFFECSIAERKIIKNCEQNTLSCVEHKFISVRQRDRAAAGGWASESAHQPERDKDGNHFLRSGE
jgi:hypothetical protein